MSGTLNKILNQFIVHGHKQEPFVCARCGSQTGDNTKDFCWCTDKDTSNRADSPTWIKNINYPRFAEAHATATQAIEALITEARANERQAMLDAVGEDENVPTGHKCYREGFGRDTARAEFRAKIKKMGGSNE